jgi:diguanylate cyclase (GGDEF)-like protein
MRRRLDFLAGAHEVEMPGMTASHIISTESPGRGHRVAALATTVILVAAAVAILPYSGVKLPANAGFMPAFGAMMFLGDLITATILFSQARAARNRSTADLGTAYLFACLIVIPHLLAFPGVFAEHPVIGESASAVWLWVVWHTGFALCVARYAWRHGRQKPDRAGDHRAGAGRVGLAPIVATVAASVAVLAWLTTAGLPYLPLIIDGTAFTRLDTLGVGPAVLLCNLVALALVVLRLRGRTVLDLWLAVAMTTATLDVTLTMVSAGRYTLGWYAARVLSLGTGVTVLVALLSELTRLFRKISDVNAQLRLLSVTDPLTQIANRRGFDDALARVWAAAARDETAVSLMMIDIDHFKGFNDRYGHPAGDECLRRIAALISSHARRPYDTAARVGGEEFVLLMPATEEAGAAMIAERLRRGIENLHIPNAASRIGHVTISAGTATLRPFGQAGSAAILTEAADRALYEAKTGGRNRIVNFHGAAETLDVAAGAALWQPENCALRA